MKIVILNQPNYRTGGVESLYQLCHMINTCGGESYIYFVEKSTDPIPQEYKKYNLQVLDVLIDTDEYQYVIPEVWTEKVYSFKNAKVSIWWLSVDNNYGKFKDFANSRITHYYQSEYAKDFLVKNGTVNVFPLHDYIDSVEYLNSPKSRKVCYNPAKGKEASEYIINQCPDIEFVPLVGMTKDQINNALSESMIYMDFGHHPGRDRIPREAALMNNIIITSRIGSASFFEDIPIDDNFKYEYLSRGIREDIASYLENYNEVIKSFENYREIIKTQKDNMRMEVLNLINGY